MPVHRENEIACFIRPRDSGGGGPRSCAVEGARAVKKILRRQE